MTVPLAVAKKVATKRGPKRPPGSGSTPRTKPEHIPTTEEVNAGITSADLEQSAAPAPSSSGPALPSALTDQRGSPSWYGKPDPVALGNAGGGFLLGLGVWALVRAYLGGPNSPGGMAGVRQLLAAKFLNRPAAGS